MLIDIKGLAREEGRLFRTLQASALRLEGDESLAEGPVEIGGDLEAVAKGILFSGTLKAQVRLECVRCLEPFRTILTPEFELLFTPKAEAAEGGEHQLHEEDCETWPAPEGRVDIARVAREQLILGMPGKALCRPDCPGLCPRCGANRNLKACECAPEPDPGTSPWKLSLVSRRESDPEGRT